MKPREVKAKKKGLVVKSVAQKPIIKIAAIAPNALIG
jgi:hypothetical protein